MAKDIRPIVAITPGDGNGIGYEVIIKALADARTFDRFTPVVYGSSKIFGYYRKSIRDLEQFDTHIVPSAAEAKPRRINIVNCLPDNVYVEPGKSSPDSARSAICCLEAAVKDIKEGLADILVTAPIDKHAMNAQGFGFPGHTEYLEERFGADEVLMVMVSDRLKVAVATGHIPLRDVAASLDKERIIRALRMLRSSLKRDFGRIEPSIGVLGLNPHAGDAGLLGDEEISIIAPAVDAAQEEGIQAYGPFSPDGYFSTGMYNRFDATLAMYHDQGLAPFKALSFETGVNFTAGLPIVRTSPDHGTAFDIAGQGEAVHSSMLYAIWSAVDVYNNRIRYDELLEGRISPEFFDREEKVDPNRPQIV